MSLTSIEPRTDLPALREALNVYRVICSALPHDGFEPRSNAPFLHLPAVAVATLHHYPITRPIIPRTRGITSESAMRQAQYLAGSGWSYQTPKSSKSVRDVPLSPTLLAALREHIAAHPYRADPDALLWPGRRKGGSAAQRAPLSYDVPIRHESVYKSYVKPAMEAVGIEPVVWYGFRNYFASACAAAGYNIHDVAKWMGHANINITFSTYMHLFTEHHDMAGLDVLASAPAQTVPEIGPRGVRRSPKRSAG